MTKWEKIVVFIMNAMEANCLQNWLVLYMLAIYLSRRIKLEL
jgi:hypothetical protein